jgi:predicted XRE-type DNA-binding protein
MATKRHQEFEYEVGSGNVFADLGLKDADAMFTRAQIGFYLCTLLKARKLKPREIAALFEIAPPKVSDLLRGQYGHFTIDQLFDCLKRLDRKVTIRISPHHTGEPYQKVEIPLEQAPLMSRKKRNTE